jgi:hypothetical protein
MGEKGLHFDSGVYKRVPALFKSACGVGVFVKD